MKRKKVLLFWLLVLGLLVGSGLSSGPAMAAGTMGDVVNELAASLNMPAADLIVLLYPSGFNPATPATEASISQLYVALNNAIIGGQITCKGAIPIDGKILCSAATLVNNAAAKAGVSGDIASGGLTKGASLSPMAGTRGGGDGTGGAGGSGWSSGGGGGGGAVSPSR